MQLINLATFVFMAEAVLVAANPPPGTKTPQEFFGEDQFTGCMVRL